MAAVAPTIEKEAVVHTIKIIKKTDERIEDFASRTVQMFDTLEDRENTYIIECYDVSTSKGYLIFTNKSYSNLAGDSFAENVNDLIFPISSSGITYGDILGGVVKDEDLINLSELNLNKDNNNIKVIMQNKNGKISYMDISSFYKAIVKNLVEDVITKLIKDANIVHVEPIAEG